MIRLASRRCKFDTSVPAVIFEKFRTFSIGHCRNKRVSCSRGYAATYSVIRDLPIYICQNLIEKDDLPGKYHSFLSNRRLSTEQDLQSINFVKLSNETLESLAEYFDELTEEAAHLQDADVSYGDGVLTVKFGNEYGTYVINRQIPNQQVWLSSPKSGPKRYDFVDGVWIYKHDGKSLHELLNEEIPDIVKMPVSFNKCSYGGK